MTDEGDLLWALYPPVDVADDDTAVIFEREHGSARTPTRLTAIDEVPRILNGKNSEVPVNRVLAGVPSEQALSTGARQNPDAMNVFTDRATA